MVRAPDPLHRALPQLPARRSAGRAHPEELARKAARAAEQSTAWESPYTGADQELHARIDAAVAEEREALLALSHALHQDPEPGFEEHRAVARVAELLRPHGIEAETGVYGLPTALRATAGTGQGPTVAVLAEYDALPGIGHACGHNVICASGVGAFLALARVMPALGGTAVLLGTPAEENGTGKETMARAGAFDGVNAAGCWAHRGPPADRRVRVKPAPAHSRRLHVHTAARDRPSAHRTIVGRGKAVR
ncbi:M20/M25/M40 family metallo-hydrolase [Streptomyces sp. NPDC002405]